MFPSDPAPDATPRSDTPPSPRPPKLLERLRDALRTRQVSDASIGRHVHWATQYILFHGRRHPQELNEDHVREFLQQLAARPEAAPDWSASARQALLLLYAEVLERPLKEYLLPSPAAGRPQGSAEPPAGDPTAGGSAAAASSPSAAPPQPPRLLNQVRDLLQVRHYYPGKKDGHVGRVS